VTDTHRIRLEPAAITFDAASDQPLLLSAAAAGIEFASSCRNGSCRACMKQLVSGRVGYRIEWPGLLPEEKADGWILPCVAYPEADLVIGGVAFAAPTQSSQLRAGAIAVSRRRRT
jgi:ferredoxin